MKKLLVILAVALGVAACQKDHDHDYADKDHQHYDGQIRLSSFGVDVKDEAFGSSSSGKADATYQSELIITVMNPTTGATIATEMIQLNGSADVVASQINAVVINDIPYGDVIVDVSLNNPSPSITYSRLMATGGGGVAYNGTVTVGSTPSVVNVSLSPADAYVDVVLNQGANIVSISTDTPDGYYIPGATTINASATDADGNLYNASWSHTLEAGHAYTVNFNAAVDLFGQITFSATVNGFDTEIHNEGFVAAPTFYQLERRYGHSVGTLNYPTSIIVRVDGDQSSEINSRVGNEVYMSSSVDGEYILIGTVSGSNGVFGGGSSTGLVVNVNQAFRDLVPDGASNELHIRIDNTVQDFIRIQN